MTGWLTSTLIPIAALTNNGTVAAPVPYTNLSAKTALLPVDTDVAAGQQPLTVAATPFQIASCFASMFQNTATSTVHTATLNTTAGLMYTEALTTAAGADYTFQIVNSLAVSAATPAFQVQIHDGTNTAGAAAVKSITNAAGTCTAVFTNTGTAAWNGTKVITFHV